MSACDLRVGARTYITTHCPDDHTEWSLEDWRGRIGSPIVRALGR